jgi:hypothetical protein
MQLLVSLGHRLATNTRRTNKTNERWPLAKHERFESSLRAWLHDREVLSLDFIHQRSYHQEFDGLECKLTIRFAEKRSQSCQEMSIRET